MTPKQREKIYRKAAKMICDDDLTYQYSCWALSELIFGSMEAIDKLDLKLFLEFHSFMPYELGLDEHDAWWHDRDSELNKSCRILALLLSAEMTKTENL